MSEPIYPHDLKEGVIYSWLGRQVQYVGVDVYWGEITHKFLDFEDSAAGGIGLPGNGPGDRFLKPETIALEIKPLTPQEA